jgi:hypothetical protein
MKRALLFAAALGFFSAPVLAQQSPTGQSSGGPARVGIPGQVTPSAPGGAEAVPATRPKKASKPKKAKKAKTPT